MLLEAEPKNCKYIGLKATIFSSTEQYIESEKALLSQLEYGCDSVKCYIMLSNVNSYQKNYVKAIEHLDKAIRLKPDSADIYVERATIYMFMKDKKNKIKNLQKAKSLGSKQAAELLEIIEHPEK